MIRIVLADDQEMVRKGLRLILESEPDLVVVGEAADGAEVVRVVRRERPDLVLMDVQMPHVDGIEATARVTSSGERSPKVLILTTFEREDYVFAALRNGASGFLLKTASPEDLVQGIRVVAAGDGLLAPSVTRRIIEDLSRRPVPSRTHSDLDRLTEREQEVLRLLARGLANSEIAAELIVGEATVKTHVSNILTKLGLRDRVQAVVYAYENGVVNPGD